MTQILEEYVPTKTIAKIVRNTLNRRWGSKNVSVRCERGTASGWINASITIPRPTDCYCEAGQPYKQCCTEARSLAAEEARTRVVVDMQRNDAKFSTFYGDMDNEPRDCFNLHIYLEKDL